MKAWIVWINTMPLWMCLLVNFFAYNIVAILGTGSTIGIFGWLALGLTNLSMIGCISWAASIMKE
jgi:hypothetical protein